MLEVIKGLPGVRQYRHAKYRRKFAREGRHNLFYGSYGTFAEALADAPEDRAHGYDTPEAGAMYEAHLDATRPQHYPALFWLSRIWRESRRVLDFGGHRGSLFYAADRLLGRGPEWWVYDVPTVVEEGTRTAEKRGAKGVHFESDLGRVPEPDVAVAAGALQYVEDSASQWLSRIPGHPRFVLLNETPFHDARHFVTLNNIGPAYCAYAIRNRSAFFDELRRLGYSLVEEWIHPDKVCEIPFHVRAGEIVYRGAFFERR